jgi:hypothetical protein
MATGPGVNQGKTAFLEEFLPENRDADEAAVNRAWRAAGHDDDISGSLVSKTRSRLKIPKKRAASGRGEGGSRAKDKARSSPRGTKARKTPQAEATPSQPGSKTVTGPNRTAFIREQLGRDATLDARAINRAWSEAGHEGEITDNLIYKTRASMGLKGRRASAPASNAGAASPESSPKGAEPAETTGTGRPARPSNGRHPAPSGTEPTKSQAVGGLGRELHEIEGEIDEMMFRLRGLGEFADVLEALRTARRLVVRSHGD